MLNSSLCDCSFMHILLKKTITVAGEGVDAAAIESDGNNNQVVLKNYTPFTDCISEINSTKVDNVKHLDVIMGIYNLIEFTNSYGKISES